MYAVCCISRVGKQRDVFHSGRWCCLAPFLHCVIKDVEEGWIGEADDAVLEFLRVLGVKEGIEVFDEGHIQGILVMV